MSVVVTGSIANDYLMDFPGRFRDQLIDGQLDHISLSFLVDELHIYRGGVAGNIAFGLGQLGVGSELVGSVGADFGDYREWLHRHGVGTGHVRTSERRHTARFLCTTDGDHNQIASFYAGAMAEAAEISLADVLQRLGGAELVLISPNDPRAMVEHTRDCRDAGVAFAADPSQQLARMEGAEIRQLVEGAQVLFTNEYERGLLMSKTGWSDSEVLARVATWVVTLGAKGLVVRDSGGDELEVIAHQGVPALDPTGVGDACRAGMIAARLRGLDWLRAGEIGCTLASFALGAVGTQEHRFTPDEFRDRAVATYGSGSGSAIDELFATVPTL